MAYAPQPSTSQAVPTIDDQCLVHQFIRIHGRRPDPAELAGLAAGPGPARTGRALTPAALSRAAVRQVARLVCRL